MRCRSVLRLLCFLRSLFFHALLLRLYGALPA